MYSNGVILSLIYQNGTIDGQTVDTTGASTSVNFSTINIGGWNTDVPCTMSGGISSLIIYTSLLSTTNCQKLEGYLGWTWWGNGNILDVTHPYHSLPL